MGRLDIFSEPERAPEPVDEPVGIDWYAMVQCQTCGEEVLDQTYFPADKVLVYICSQEHKSMIEGMNLL